jgi:hypothetical protein
MSRGIVGIVCIMVILLAVISAMIAAVVILTLPIDITRATMIWAEFTVLAIAVAGV